MNLPDAQKLMIEQDKKMIKTFYDGTDLLNLPPVVQNHSPVNHIYSGPKTKTQKIQEVKELFDKIPEFVADKKEKKIISGYKNEIKLEKKKTAESLATQYHLYAKHPTTLIEDCKACRVVMNFVKWQKKSIPSPKDINALASAWTKYDGQPTSVIIDDPPIGAPPGQSHSNTLLPWKPAHANTCTCKKCEKQGTGSYVKKDKPTFVAKKGSSFTHYRGHSFGGIAIGFDTEMGEANPSDLCTTSYSTIHYPPIPTICNCGETIIKWE